MFRILLLVSLGQQPEIPDGANIVIGHVRHMDWENDVTVKHIRVTDYKTGEFHNFHFYGTDVYNSSYTFNCLPEGSWVKAVKTSIKRDMIFVLDTFDDQKMALAQEANILNFTNNKVTEKEKLILKHLGNAPKQKDRRAIMQSLVDKKDYRLILLALKGKDIEAASLADEAIFQLKFRRWIK